MTTITISLQDKVLDQLRQKAREVGLSPEELARVGLESWLRQGSADFEEAARYVFDKNAELYRRLA